MTNYWLDLAFRRRTLAELELQAKGYNARLSQVAAERAWGSAWKKAEPISETIRAQAFYDLLQEELRSSEDWCRQMESALQEA